ncbi:hypothetical protein [Oscillibacter sp.]|uniref:hypothetical protein n=1 Tax=Oscillibacter sp. TaxID=1945593 RepID=UPI00289D263F|nr:hypothetical protein [Oscillibacter sp.]
MKKSRVLWGIVFLLAIVAGYMRYYPITNDSIEAEHIIQEKFDANAEIDSGIGLNNQDFYYFAVVENEIAVLRMKRGLFNRFRYEGMSRTDANFVNGVVNSKGNKYLLVGGRNPNHEIEKMTVTLDNIQYDIDLVNPGDSFFEYIQIENETIDNHVFLNNTTLYNADGEDITASFNTSSGGV